MISSSQQDLPYSFKPALCRVRFFRAPRPFFEDFFLLSLLFFLAVLSLTNKIYFICRYSDRVRSEWLSNSPFPIWWVYQPLLRSITALQVCGILSSFLQLFRLFADTKGVHCQTGNKFIVHVHILVWLQYFFFWRTVITVVTCNRLLCSAWGRIWLFTKSYLWIVVFISYSSIGLHIWPAPLLNYYQEIFHTCT